jgi:hypothetical protein
LSLNLLVVTTIRKRRIFLTAAATLALASGAAAPAHADHQVAGQPGQSGTGPAAPSSGPSISGVTEDGQTLTANLGSWGNGVTLSHRWMRCNADGVTNCVFLHADNSTTYVLTAGDVGKTIKLRVTGQQAIPQGRRDADSAPTAVVDAAAPPIQAHPGNTGRAVVGATLTATSARFGYGTPPFTEDEYQWERCAAPDFTTCTEIGGATFLKHILTEADLGSQLRIRERATYGPRRETVDAYSPNSRTVVLAEESTPGSPPELLDPFPVIAIGGVLTSDGANLSLLRVRGPIGARVTVRCVGTRCPARRVRRTIGENERVRIRPFERLTPFGTNLIFRITMPGAIGKYTRVRIRDGRRPVRVDRCLQPGATRPSPCPPR